MMNRRLAIIDWGIGGISIHKLVNAHLGDVPVIYFSDTGVRPYGTMSRAEITARVNKVVAFVRSKGATHVVIGCNAASTIIRDLDAAGLTIEGIIDSAVHLAVRSKPGRLGLLGGRRTVVSGTYRRAFEEKGIDVSQRIAQSLSGLIESGDVSSSELREHCRKILRPLRKCSHILLACTHYPAIIGVLKEFTSEETVFIDPVIELIQRIGDWKLPTGEGDMFFTSGEPGRMILAARNAFDVKIKSARKITL